MDVKAAVKIIAIVDTPTIKLIYCYRVMGAIDVDHLTICQFLFPDGSLRYLSYSAPSIIKPYSPDYLNFRLMDGHEQLIEVEDILYLL